jgi:PleD family two-component response regulator
MRTAVAGLELAHEGTRVPLTVSVGLVESRAGESFSGLLQRADAALYEANAGGRNCVVARS